MTEKLKHCPFCGHEVTLLYSYSQRRIHFAVCCQHCGCVGPGVTGKPGGDFMLPTGDILNVKNIQARKELKNATKLWNERAGEVHND